MRYMVDIQDWTHWPRALIMRHVWTTNGHDRRREVRRYIPEEQTDELRDEVRYLKSDNRYLKDRIHDMREDFKRQTDVETCDRLRGRLHEVAADRDRIKAENAKLRELVRDLYRCSDPCNDCPHYNGSSNGFYCRLGIGWKARRMRELGIEVDG